MKSPLPNFVIRSLVIAAGFAAFLISAEPRCRAQLLPADDFNGKSLDDWGLDYLKWAVSSGLGGQSLPDTEGNARFLPADFGVGDFVINLTIQQGTALVRAPFFVYGERYDNGSEDNPADPFIDTIFDETTVRVTYDGSVVLEGIASGLPDRLFGVTVLPEAIPYAAPVPRGPGLNAIAATFSAGGITTIFDDLPLGEHTIRDEFNSTVFGSRSFTYNVTVVPEPSSVLLVGAGAIGWTMIARRRTATLARRS